MILGSLKFRLALASALLIALSVAVTVLLSVREVRDQIEQAAINSNLGAAQLAATLSGSVVEHQRALLAAAQEWPKDQVTTPTRNAAFLQQQAVLRTLFNELRITPGEELPVKYFGEPLLSAAGPAASATAGKALPDLLISRPLASGETPPPMLTGVLKLSGPNFLAKLAQAARLDDLNVQTIVANQQGYVLGHADEDRLMSLVDEDVDLQAAVAQWRRRGSPLEPAPWTERYGQTFVAMAAVPGTDWMVFRLARIDTVFSEASRSITRTVMMGAAVGGVGALAIFGLTALLLQPMDKLRRRALLALDPEQPPQLGWPEASGEVGELSRALKHVSEQLAASRQDMEQSLLKMQAVMDFAPVGIAFTREGRIELASRQLEEMLGYGPGELECPLENLLPPEIDAAALISTAEAAFAERQAYDTELPLLRRDGSTLWTVVHGAAVQGGQRRRIWVAADATESRRRREALEWQARHDSLTELINRREFEQRLGQLVADRRRRDVACALFIDLDHFKQVNDGAGHAAGDLILKRAAQALRDCVRSGDTVARLGGDEFAVLLPACALAQALRIAEQMRERIARDGVCDSKPELRVTSSIGVVEIDPRHQSLDEVLEAADQACYAAKHAGRNAVRSAAVRIADGS